LREKKYNRHNSQAFIVSNKIHEKNQRISKIRRQRGYNWEDTLVKRFNSIDGWNAFRLGSPSTGLPDVLAVSSEHSTIYAIEAKSGTGTTLPIPFDQIIRCLKWSKAFKLYKTRKVIFAFKFLSKKRIGPSTYERRELREFFKIWDDKCDITDCVCTYSGETYALKEGRRVTLILKHNKMPFSKKHNSK
jgi:Holliday junction resolvase